jgi:hypothetical protein
VRVIIVPRGKLHPIAMILDGLLATLILGITSGLPVIQP